MWLLHWLPLPLLGRLGEAVGSLLFMTIKSRRRITLINLRLCMPERSEQERHAIAKQHFQAYARSVFERGVLWWGSKARLQRLIQVEPGVPVASMQSRPTILLCPHFVCLEIAGIAAVLEAPLCSIYTAQRNKAFDTALRKGRTRFGQVDLFSRADGVKPIIRSMRKGWSFFMLPDMDFGAKDAEFVPFFGTLAATLSAPARIAAATGAQIIPVVATFLPNYQGWKVTFYPAWEDYPGDDIVAATRRMNAFIEARALETPAEYFWTHKRFKTRPDGEPNVYARGADATPVAGKTTATAECS
jgi:KDO2-lipid IV(A) lauroyltransferase